MLMFTKVTMVTVGEILPNSWVISQNFTQQLGY